MDELKEKAWRNDALAKVTGRARYTDDYVFPGMLHGATLRAQYPHARILSIDASNATSATGLLCRNWHYSTASNISITGGSVGMDIRSCAGARRSAPHPSSPRRASRKTASTSAIAKAR